MEQIHTELWDYDKAAVISVTKHCQNKCGYCLAQYSESKEHIDFSMLTPLAEKLQKAGWTLEITGGEPFTIPGLAVWANEMSRTGDIIILTNGYKHKDIEPLLEDKVKILMTWHRDQCHIDNFYSTSERENTQYSYVCHPKNFENGNFEKDMEILKTRFKKKVHLAFFEGIYNGKLYKTSDPIYDGLDKGYVNHLFMPGKYLNIEMDGTVYFGYEFTEPQGHIIDFDVERADALPDKSYVEHISEKKLPVYKEQMEFCENKEIKKEWCIARQAVEHRTNHKPPPPDVWKQINEDYADVQANIKQAKRAAEFLDGKQRRPIAAEAKQNNPVEYIRAKEVLFSMLDGNKKMYLDITEKGTGKRRILIVEMG